MRWWVRNHPQTGSHFLIAIYRHLVADLVSSCLLVREILRAYHHLSSEEGGPEPVPLPAASCVMNPRWRARDDLRALLQTVRRYARMRRAYRLPERPGGQGGWDFCVLQAPRGLLSRLVSACRERGITMNEAFLAALCGGLAEMTPHRRSHPRRRGLAMAHVVNVREEAGPEFANRFGVYLREAITIIDQPDAGDFASLLNRIVPEVRREKAGRHPGEMDWNFWALTRLSRWPMMKNTRDWYRKVYPLAAGLSNVRMNASWFNGVSERILDSISIVPPGPAVPLVLFPTTVHDRLNVSMVYREACLTRSEAQRLMHIFFRRLGEFSGDGHTEGSAYA